MRHRAEAVILSTGMSIPAAIDMPSAMPRWRCRDRADIEATAGIEAQTGRNQIVSLNLAAKRNGVWNTTEVRHEYNLAADGIYPNRLLDIASQRTEHNRNVSVNMAAGNGGWGITKM